MADGGNFLKKDLGGLPVWAWGLIVVGGVGIGLFFLKGNNPITNLLGTGTSSGGQSGSSEAGDVVGQSGNGTVPTTFNNPDTGFAQTNVNGQSVPILPQGYQPITNSGGQVLAFGPVVPTANNGVGTTSSTGGTTTKSAVTVKSGSLETTPHDTNGGKNLLTVPSGATVQYVSGPVPDPTKGSSKTYYVVQYNGQKGYLGSDTLSGNNPFQSSGGGSDRIYQGGYFGAY